MVPDGYAIRLARKEDLPRLADIELQAGTRFEPYGLKDIVQVLTPPKFLQEGICNRRCWVATTADDCPVGFALASAAGRMAHLDELDVLPKHGCQGLGTALLETVCNCALANNLKAITLSTFSYIPWNAPFYAKLGFRILKLGDISEAQQKHLQEETARGVPTENRVVMCREL